jgi:predicted nucleotidyltransferase
MDEIQNSLELLIEKVNTKVSLDCVILFGSRSRDDYTSSSDIDIIFIGDFQDKFIERSTIVLENFDFHLKVGIDAFCYTQDEFKRMFYRGVVSILDSIDHGICMYGNAFFDDYVKKLNYFKSKGLKRSPPVWILPKEMSVE